MVVIGEISETSCKSWFSRCALVMGGLQPLVSVGVRVGEIVGDTAIVGKVVGGVEGNSVGSQVGSDPGEMV